eukprot:GHRR01026686.1.p1 GENE.GHRR01026686.1~~GHRR01026686.1.p1  ORF type:complete len:484 (+),score=129.44 GHRR01026686.1:291-1742(+)
MTAGAHLGPHHKAVAYQMTNRAALATIAAACIAVVIAVMASMPFILLLPVAYGLSEAIFAIVYYYRYLLLSYQPVKHRPLSHDPWVAFNRAMEHLREYADIKHFLSIWFHGAPYEDIKRENVADLIAYAFWYKTPDDIAAEGRAHELQQMVRCMEDIWEVQLTPGHNAKLRCMCHLWEPMKHWYRPLGFYLFMEFAAVMGHVALLAAGFRAEHWMGMTYYTKNMCQDRQRSQVAAAPPAYGAGSDQAAGPPLVLLHGIGMGLIPYISMLFNMAATGRPVLALQFKHIAMRWVLWVPTLDEVAEVLVGILRREAVKSCCLVGHSYGTAVAARLLQQHPALIKQLCLIDPVCFTMFMPNLLRNFLYESPKTGSMIGDFMMMSAARDLHVSATLSRRFFWTDVNLWEEQVPADTLVVLSGKDVLMAAEEVSHNRRLQTFTGYFTLVLLPSYIQACQWHYILYNVLHKAAGTCYMRKRESRMAQRPG